MARRKSSRQHRHRRTRVHRARHTKRTRSRHTRRVRRTRRGGDGSIGAPYPNTRMMYLNPNQLLGGSYYTKSNQSGGSTCKGGTLQPSGNVTNASCKNGQMATTLMTGARA